MKRSIASTPVVEEGPHLYVGKPCRHGHAGLRYRASGNCVECSRSAAAAARQVAKARLFVEADVKIITNRI